MISVMCKRQTGFSCSRNEVSRENPHGHPGIPLKMFRYRPLTSSWKTHSSNSTWCLSKCQWSKTTAPLVPVAPHPAHLQVAQAPRPIVVTTRQPSPSYYEIGRPEALRDWWVG